MQPISNLFGKKVAPPKKTRRTERGDLIEYFFLEARKEWDEKYGKLTIGRIAYKLSHLNVKDLYYLRSVCELARRDGRSWSKTFWWEIKPREKLQRAS